MLFVTSNNCYIGKAHEILVLIVHVSDNRKCRRIQSGYIGAVLAISPFENIISSRLKLYLKQCRSRSTGFFNDSRHAKTYSDLRLPQVVGCYPCRCDVVEQSVNIADL